MSVFARFMGLLAVAVGIVAAVVPLAVESVLDPGDAILIAFVGVFAGLGLFVLGKVLALVEKIEVNTNWFSVSAPGSARPDADVEPEQTPPPRRTPASPGKAERTEPPPDKPAASPPAPDKPAASPPPPPNPPRPEQAKPAPQGAAPAPARAIGPEVYDANIHPPAVEEWAYGKYRVMTLQDGSVAAELDGIWQRFVNVEDMAAFLQPPGGGAPK